MAGVIDGVGDEKERLEERDIDAGGLVAATHLHRYELAAALLGGDRVLDLCCGTGYGARALAANAASVVGVDVAPEAIAAAERAVGPEEEGRLRFEEADALAYLRGLGADAFDAVVCFEGIEHVPDPAAVVAELVRLAGAGTRVILSLPNSRGFDERNRFHVTDFGWEEAQQLIAGFDAPVVLEQYLAEGSLIVPAEGRPARAAARIFSEEARDRPAWASHWMVLVGFEDAAAGTAAARLGVAVAPHQNA